MLSRVSCRTLTMFQIVDPGPGDNLLQFALQPIQLLIEMRCESVQTLLVQAPLPTELVTHSRGTSCRAANASPDPSRSATKCARRAGRIFRAR